MILRFDYRVGSHDVAFKLRNCGRGWDVQVFVDRSFVRSQAFVALSCAGHWADEELRAMQEKEESESCSFPVRAT